ncbi:unnamed protein product, partial [Ceratitis capitata]
MHNHIATSTIVPASKLLPIVFSHKPTQSASLIVVVVALALRIAAFVVVCSIQEAGDLQRRKNTCGLWRKQKLFMNVAHMLFADEL